MKKHESCMRFGFHSSGHEFVVCILYLVDQLITKKMWIAYTDTADERINTKEVSNKPDGNLAAVRTVALHRLGHI